MDDPDPPAIYAGAISTAEALPGILPRKIIWSWWTKSVVARIWAGTDAVTAPTHYDISDNIACVVGGHRRFTFFPPEQLPNLYVGPLDFTPAGQPTSMVKLAEPDMQRYPRFAQALAAAGNSRARARGWQYLPPTSGGTTSSRSIRSTFS